MSYCRTVVLAVPVTVCAAIISFPVHSAELDLERRVEYQSRVELAYSEQQYAAAPDHLKSDWVAVTPSPEEIRKKIEARARLADALDRLWGTTFEQADFQAEYERILEGTRDREMLERLLGALDNEPAVIAACLIEPILVQRAVHRSYWWDEAIHAELKRKAGEELLSDDGDGNLTWFSGSYTETEWRLVEDGNTTGVEFRDGLQIRSLDRTGWEDLLVTLGPGRHTTHRFSELAEDREYFSSFVILQSDTASMRIGTYTWWKEPFSRWWGDNESQFSADPRGSERDYRLEQPRGSSPAEDETKERGPVNDAWFSIADDGAPAARSQHTAVWTGTQMIVWGGTNGAQVFNSGGVYDPATDSWSATSQGANCPSSRVGHSADWGLNRMFIWGGWDTSTPTNTGAKYQPSTDTWTSIPVDANTPRARYGHLGLMAGTNTLYVWGGRTTTGITSTGGFYNNTSDAWAEWTPEAETPSGRNEMVGVVDSTYGKLVVWGGNDGSQFVNDGGQWKINLGGWNDIASTGAPSARIGHTGVASGGVCTDFANVYFWGGTTLGGTTNTGGIYNSIGTGAWMGETPTGTDVPMGRFEHSAVMDPIRDWMTIWGGTTSGGATDTGGILDLCTDSWTATDTVDIDCPSARSLHSAVWTGKAMLVWGGESTSPLYRDDGAAYTYCWGSPETSQTPTVTDDDPCDASGVRVAWSTAVTWNDYDVHRRVSILRDGLVIASDLMFTDLSFLDDTAVQDQSHDYQVRFSNSCGAEVTTSSRSGVDQGATAPVVTSSPTAVDADGCVSSSGIDVSWSQDPAGGWGDNEVGDRKYRVWRWRYAYEDWVALGSQLDYGTTAYHDPSPGLGNYRVKYINGCGDNADSPESGLVTDQDGSTPTVTQMASAADADSCDFTGNVISWPQDPDDWGDGGTGDRLYRVRRSTDGATFDPIGSNIAYATTNFVDTTANPDQLYHYQVRYKNGCSLDADSGNDSTTDTVIPAAPTVTTNSSAADPDNCDDGGIVVTWNEDADTWCDSGSGSRSYDILRDGTPIVSGIAYPSSSYTDNTGDDGTTYSYQVRYNNKNDLSASTTGDNGRDLPMTPALPANNNTGTDVDSCDATGVLVTWDADPDGNWGDGGGTHTYEVLRDGVSLQAGIAYGTTEFTDTTGTPGTEYLYTVRYVNCGGFYSETPGVTATDFEGGAPTISVNSSTVDPDTCVDGGVVISWDQDPHDWNDDGGGSRTYDVLRDGTVLHSGIAYPTSTYTDTSGDNGTLYLYQVRYNNSCGASSTTGGDDGNDRPIAPDQPINNTASDVDACDSTGVLVTWSADPDGNWGDGGGTHTYEVLRDGVTLQTGIAYGTTQFVDTTGAPGTEYLYTVRYVNCGGLYSQTSGASATDLTAPAAPAELTVRDGSACEQSGVWLTWGSTPGATSYDIRIDGSTILADVDHPLFHDPSDTATHTYEVRASTAVCSSIWSDAVSFADNVDPDAQFCDSFETGDTTAWWVTVP